jgi:hypothetical protein
LWKALLTGFLLGGFGLVEGYGLRKDILAFRNQKDASQAATTLAAYLDIGIVEEEV